MLCGKVVVDHPQTASPPFATPNVGPASLPESSCPGNQVSCLWLACQLLLKCPVSFIVQVLGQIAREGWSFKEFRSEPSGILLSRESGLLPVACVPALAEVPGILHRPGTRTDSA